MGPPQVQYDLFPFNVLVFSPLWGYASSVEGSGTGTGSGVDAGHRGSWRHRSRVRFRISPEQILRNIVLMGLLFRLFGNFVLFAVLLTFALNRQRCLQLIDHILNPRRSWMVAQHRASLGEGVKEPSKGA